MNQGSHFTVNTINRAARVLAIGLLAAAGVSLLPAGEARAADDKPDFYGTIVATAADRTNLTVAPTKTQQIVVDVRELGSEPWEIGAFAPNNVVLLKTKYVGTSLVATGWEQARDGSQIFEGIERGRSPDREKRGNR
jgi:hypothetical protein